MIRLLLIGVIVQFFSTGCSRHYTKQKEIFSHVSLKENVPQPLSNDSIYRFRQKVEKETGRVIAVTEGALTKDGAESTLGNFVCDALKQAAGKIYPAEKIDVVIINRGGLRMSIAAGEIKVGTIFELMPFENEMVLIKMSGECLLKFGNLVIDQKHPFFGLKVKIKDKQVSMTMNDGTSIDKEKFYTVESSDYLARGSDNFLFLKEGAIANSGLKIRDAIIRYCEKTTEEGKQIKPYTDGRIEISK
ncbi:MAG: 5'-nucleotidase C-terminal domain-containing protein [Bacteroidetes bacterium]|nr:5'-nucleotidase C-terminal domain-containing protein [Bacteroidota bacterium]